ncbi:MAG TPA: hypothetical protein VFU31_00970 [Candidatus Binatia bacterium]|nr:hypothetical protein [Candidatus Binatia bacterium]
MSLKTALGFLFIVASAIPALRAGEPQIYFKNSPPVEQLRPFYDPTTLSLLVTAADGRPVTQGWLEIRLDAPKPSGFFSTDFPLVEGSRLLEMRLPLRSGRAEWTYLFPIRGKYEISVDFVTAEGKQATRTFSLQVREHTNKWTFLGIFTLALFASGMVAGRIFTRASRGAKDKLVACLLLSFVCSGSSAALAAREEYSGWLGVDAATVGKPTRVHWRLSENGGGGRPRAALTLTITHLEKSKIVFAVERLWVAGEFSMDFHFSDGANYRVLASAEIPGYRTVRTERYLSVTGVEPQVAAMLPALSFFVAVIAIGLGVGRWSKKAPPG